MEKVKKHHHHEPLSLRARFKMSTDTPKRGKEKYIFFKKNYKFREIKEFFSVKLFSRKINHTFIYRLPTNAWQSLEN